MKPLRHRATGRAAPDQTWATLDGPGPRPRRVAIFGGTFNPIHYAHLAVAEQARVALDLDCVLFMPAGSPPQKTTFAPADDRAAMVCLAIADNPHFALSRLEIDRPGPSYTVDTLAQISAGIAERGLSVELYLIITTETLAGLPTWHEAARIPALTRLIVTSRTGIPRPAPGWLEAHFPRLTDRFIYIDTLTGDYSSSDVRALIRAGVGARYLVPPAVGAYLDAHGLYR